MRREKTKPRAQLNARRIQLYFIDEKLFLQEYHMRSSSSRIRLIAARAEKLEISQISTANTSSSLQPRTTYWMWTNDDCCHDAAHAAWIMSARATNGVWKINYIFHWLTLCVAASRMQRTTTENIENDWRFPIHMHESRCRSMFVFCARKTVVISKRHKLLLLWNSLWTRDKINIFQLFSDEKRNSEHEMQTMCNTGGVHWILNGLTNPETRDTHTHTSSIGIHHFSNEFLFIE